MVNGDDKLYPRMFAWWKLIKIYGTLRFDDHRGLSPSSLALSDAALTGTLTRTKTSGAGKTRQSMPLFVAAGASISGNGWLRVGHQLWEQHASISRLLRDPSELRTRRRRGGGSPLQ